MKQSVLLRELRKEALQLQARHYRLAMRDDIGALSEALSRSTRMGSARSWLSLARSALSLWPERWGNAFSLGLLAWRLARRVLARRRAANAAAHSAEVP
ncbi:MAG: hypothetical protein QM776_15730 [Rhodocyclaceae bacterium]